MGWAVAAAVVLCVLAVGTAQSGHVTLDIFATGVGSYRRRLPQLESEDLRRWGAAKRLRTRRLGRRCVASNAGGRKISPCAEPLRVGSPVSPGGEMVGRTPSSATDPWSACRGVKGLDASTEQRDRGPRVSAKRLRRLGINLVRLHHMDSSPDRDPNDAHVNAAHTAFLAPRRLHHRTAIASRSICTFCSTLRLAVSITMCSRSQGW